MRRGATALALGLGLLLVLFLNLPRAAWSSKPKHSTMQVAAERLLQKGIAALISRDFATASQSLGAAYRQWPHPQLLYYLGTLAQTEGRALDAQDLMRRYLSDPRQEETADSPARKDAARILAQPRPPYGKLQVEGEDATIVVIDGRLVGSLPLSQPLLLAPGAHKITLEAHGQSHEEAIEMKVARFIEMRYSTATRSDILSVVPVMLVLDEPPAQSAAAEGPGRPSEKALEKALDQALQAEHFSPLRRAEALTGAQDRNLVSCLATLPCQAQLARENGADYALRVLEVGDPSGTRQLGLELLHAEVGEIAARIEASCPGSCSPADATELFQKRLPELIAEARKRQFGHLQIDSQPAGAEVFSGERRLGLTPLDTAQWAGPMELELRYSGYLSERRKLTVPDGDRRALTIELRPVPPPQLLAPVMHWVQPPRPRWRYYAGGGIIGAGVIISAVGISALAANETCVGAAPPDGGVCMMVHRTLGVGGPLLGVGLGLLSGGGLVIAIPSPKRLEAERPSTP